MENEWLEIIENIIDSPDKIAALPDDSYVHPAAIFFGRGEDLFNDYEIDADSFNYENDLAGLVAGVFLHLSAGFNVRVRLFGGESVIPLSRVLDIFYTKTVQYMAKNAKIHDLGVDCGQLHIVIEDEGASSRVHDQVDMIGTGMMNVVASSIRDLASNAAYFRIGMEALSIIEEDLRILLPYSGAHVFLNLGDSSYFHYQSMVNFDMFTSWFRFEKAVQHLKAGYRLNPPEGDSSAARYASVRRLVDVIGSMMRDDSLDRLKAIVKTEQEFYIM